MLRRFSGLLSSALLLVASVVAGHLPEPAAIERLRFDVHSLSSTTMEGRRVGSAGAARAADFIARRFADLGLQPVTTDDFFQEFTFINAVRPGPGNRLAFRFSDSEVEVAETDDFQPLAFSATGEVSGEVVFAGYGIRSDTLEYNDYAGLDVTGKVVLVLRFSPDGDDPQSRFQPYMALRRKASEARAAGAVALLVAPGPVGARDTSPVRLSFDASFSDAGLPVVGLSTALAASLFRDHGFHLNELQERINQRQEPASRPLGVTVSLRTDLVQEHASCHNVIAILPGSSPELAGEKVVVGAHYDHLGFGGEGSGSLVPDKHAVHPGADDNASGIAAMLEIARRLARRPAERTVVFAAFSGEERGLLGSSHMVQNLPFPQGQLVAMVNLDMVGRPPEGPGLNIGGYGTAKEWPVILDEINRRYGFRLSTSRGGFGASDHSSFYAADIPVLFFFTGAHEDYHRPSDHPHRLDYPGMEVVTSFAADAVRAVADQPSSPSFVRVADEGTGERRGLRVRTGVIPEFGWEGAGFRISGVRGGSPADRAGLRAGDVIVGFGDREIRNIYDFMYALGDHRPGETVPVAVEREGRTFTVEVTLEAGGGGGR